MLKVRWGWVVLVGLAGGACATAATPDGPAAPVHAEAAPGTDTEPERAIQRQSEPSPAPPSPKGRPWPSQQLAELLRFLDDRKSTSQPRARNLITTEVLGLERLVEATASESPDRPQLARRLAESYAELRSAADRDEASASGAEAPEIRSVADAAAARAIALFEQFLHDYPAYPKRDEVFYSLAIEYGFSADVKQVRQNMFRLLQEVPISRHVPLAYFSFGELFVFEAATDATKLELAKAAFKEASRYPAPQNRGYCLSLDRVQQLGSGQAKQLLLSYDEQAACARVQPATP